MLTTLPRRLLEREPASRLDGLHRELRHRARDPRKADKLRHVELLVGGKVRGRDPEQVVGVAEHAPALDHLVQLRYARLERFHRRQTVPHLHRDMDEYLEAAIDCGRVDDRAIAGDHPRLFKPANSTQAGGGTEADPIRELDVGEPTLRLQMLENCSTYRIRSRRF